jgi:hypothetical protein
MTETPFLSHFSPQWTRPEALEQILVQRESLLSDSVEKIRESIVTGNKHHLLFIGSRGAGKTHLITLIHHRLQQADLLDRARFAWLNEDEIATSFLKLLVLIYRSLSERYPDDFPASTIRALAGLDPLAAEDKLGQSLLRDLGNLTLVVLMENLDSLFRTLPESELLRWRAFVQNHPVFATIGTAQALFAGVSERTEPFFGFFDTRHLEPLSVEDARLLLKNIARLQGKTELLEFLETPTGKARVAAIHDLAGGNPRLYLIFSEFLNRTSLNELGASLRGNGGPPTDQLLPGAPPLAHAAPAGNRPTALPPRTPHPGETDRRGTVHHAGHHQRTTPATAGHALPAFPVARSRGLLRTG